MSSTRRLQVINSVTVSANHKPKLVSLAMLGVIVVLVVVRRFVISYS